MTVRIIKNLFCVSLLLVTVSCVVDPMPEGWNWGANPRPLKGMKGFPPATNSYGMGFRDGCGIGWSTVTAGLMGDLVPKVLNPEQITKNSDYNAGWWDGFEQCVYIIDWDIL